MEKEASGVAPSFSTEITVGWLKQLSGDTYTLTECRDAFIKLLLAGVFTVGDLLEKWEEQEMEREFNYDEQNREQDERTTKKEKEKEKKKKKDKVVVPLEVAQTTPHFSEGIPPGIMDALHAFCRAYVEKIGKEGGSSAAEVVYVATSSLLSSATRGSSPSPAGNAAGGSVGRSGGRRYSVGGAGGSRPSASLVEAESTMCGPLLRWGVTRVPLSKPSSTMEEIESAIKRSELGNKEDNGNLRFGWSKNIARRIPSAQLPKSAGSSPKSTPRSPRTPRLDRSLTPTNIANSLSTLQGSLRRATSPVKDELERPLSAVTAGTKKAEGSRKGKKGKEGKIKKKGEQSPSIVAVPPSLETVFSLDQLVPMTDDLAIPETEKVEERVPSSPSIILYEVTLEKVEPPLRPYTTVVAVHEDGPSRSMLQRYIMNAIVESGVLGRSRGSASENR